MIPSTRLMLPFKIRTKRSTDTPMFHHKSLLKISSSDFAGKIAAQAPITTSRLKMLEPTMFPREISLFPARPALILTAASGALVPMATMVRPMITEGTFKIPAIEEEPSTNKSAPLISKTKPISKSKYIIKMTS